MINNLDDMINQSHPHRLACLMDWGSKSAVTEQGLSAHKARKNLRFPAYILMLDGKDKYLITIFNSKKLWLSHRLQR